MKTMQAVGNRIIIEPDSPETTTESGIILTETLPDVPNKGVVLSVGDKVENINEGDYIVYDPLSATSIVHDNIEYFIMYEQVVLAVINK